MFVCVLFGKIIINVYIIRKCLYFHSVMSYTLTVSKRSSVIDCDIFPPLPLNDGFRYEVGLLSFSAYYSVPNVDEDNNQFHYGEGKRIVLPVGSYELSDVAAYLREELKKEDITFTILANNNTLQLLIKCSVVIDFTQPNSIGSLLGFNKTVLAANEAHYAENMVDIIKLNTIDIQSNISSGAYINGVPSHSLHMFAPKVAPGFKIIEAPHNIIYLPVDVTVIDKLALKICDQNGHLVNFRGEEITIRLHIRRAA
jgi:hypothetical protein